MRFIEAVDPGFWGSTASLVWYFFWAFVFVAYLVVLFTIIGDLFADPDLNGWLKALWLLLLMFLPFLTALAYLLVRGRSMSERKAARAQRHLRAQAEMIKKAASAPPSAAEEIANAKALLDAAAISQAEFDAIKAKALG